MAYFENNEINNCTRCGKKFTDLRMQVTLDLYTERLRDTGIWEEIPNLCQESVEYLCPECFDKWVEIQSQMDIPYQENPKYNDVDQHLTDKYREQGSKKLSDPYREPQKGDLPPRVEECHCTGEKTQSATPNFDAKIEELCRAYENRLTDIKKEETQNCCEETCNDCEPPKESLFTEELHSNEPEVIQAQYAKPNF